MKIERSALLMHSPQQMFDLVNDVESYPTFLANCQAARVLESTDHFMRASLTLGKGPVSQTFTTRNDLSAPHSIKLSLDEGPFKHLSGEWHFTALGETGCKVALELSFDFKSTAVRLAFGKLFEQIAGSLVQSFVDRAGQVYKS